MNPANVIPTEFNEDVMHQLQTYEHILYFKWDLMKDTMDFMDSPENTPFDFQQHIEQASTALWVSHLIYPEDLPQMEDYLDKTFMHQIHDENGRQHTAIKLRMLGKDRPKDVDYSDEHYLWVDLNVLTYYDDNGPVVAFGYIRNINAQHISHLKLEHQAEHDLLTGLLNKPSMQHRVEEYLANLDPHGMPPALLIIDADGFKAINDNFGHLFGDAVLTDMAMAITKNFRHSDIIGRIGGDEFMVLFCEMPSVELVKKRCAALGDTLRHTYQNGDEELPFSVSIGIALCPDHGTTYEELFQHADRALYEAKSKGRDQYCLYHASLFGNASVTTTRDPMDTADMQQTAFRDNMIEFIFKLLYETNSPDATISLTLGMFGKQFNLDRVAVDRYSELSNQYTTVFEWLSPNGVSTREEFRTKDDTELLNLKNELVLSQYQPSSYGVMALCNDTREAAAKYQEALSRFRVGSYAHIRITHGSEDMGCVGFEAASAPRNFTDEELRGLSIFSVLLGNILLSRESDELLIRSNRHLRDILDHMQEFIYVIDKETYEPVFFNRTIRQAIESVSVNLPCYKRFHGLEEPCYNCPVSHLSKEGNEYLEGILYNWGGPTPVRTYNIEWDAEKHKICALIIQDPF